MIQRFQPQWTGRADLHMHTSASDGTMPVRELLNYVAAKRPWLDVIAITDHDTLEAAWWAYEQRQHYPFDIIPGIEVSSLAGHILALWVTKPIARGMDLPDTVAAIHEAGGVAVLAHPFHIEMGLVRKLAWRYWRSPEVLLESGLDAIEAHNAAIVTPGSNRVAGQLARRIGLAVTGGSDAHTPGAVGSGITRFAGTTAADLRHALETRQTATEGASWHIREYIAYLRHERQRRGRPSLAKPV